LNNSIRSKLALCVIKDPSYIGVDKQEVNTLRGWRRKARKIGVDLQFYARLIYHRITMDFSHSKMDPNTYMEKFLKGEIKPLFDGEKSQKNKEVRLIAKDRKELEHKINSEASLKNIEVTSDFMSRVHIDSFDSEFWKKLRTSGWAKYFEEDFNFNPLDRVKGLQYALIKGDTKEITWDTLSNKGLFDEMYNLSVDTEHPIKDIEKGFAAKFGSYKALPFKSWVDKIELLYEPTNATFYDEHKGEQFWHLMKATKSVTDQLRLAAKNIGLTNESGYISRLDLEDAYEKVTKSGNSGFPFCTSKWSTNEKMVDYYKKQAHKMLNRKFNYNCAPHILFKRVQPNGQNPKMRPVLCPPKSEAIASKCYSEPLLSVFKSIPQYSGYNGGENVYDVLEQMSSGKEHWISSDYSSFDATCQELMKFVFMVLCSLFEPEDRGYLQDILTYYLTGDIITPMGMVRLKEGEIHGLLSGEGLTSIIGTLANAISHEYTLSQMNVKANVISFGDDVAIFTDDEFDPHQYSQLMGQLGLKCNPSKQEITSGPKAHFSFLGYYYFRSDLEELTKHQAPLQFWPVFPIMRNASGFAYKEFFISEGKLEVINGELMVIDGIDASKVSFKEMETIALALKLNVSRNHPNWKRLVKTIRERHQLKLNTTLLKDRDSLIALLRSSRASRNLGLTKTAIVRLLWMLEDQYHPSEIFNNYGITMEELQLSRSLDFQPKV
jgi:hypothetical protein